MTEPVTFDGEELEKYSSAVTLSDMEVFIFPDLLYALVLANIMSPRLWTWREDPWFAKLEKMSPYRRILRLKQYIIDHYEFNLDLDTWGLTTKDRELARFSPWVDEQMIAESNALFGYEGDKYYFDIDIRRHFGLDKYTTDVIPYWKTETVEAMDAFRHKEGYVAGAGECVSLSTLYAAALFVVCGIPLEDIYLMATPLHSQNFIVIKDGMLTNNRRLVTKKMWFNGTELTAKAQRALRNEQVTIVAHNTGHVHVLYDRATISPVEYDRFKKKLQRYLTTRFDRTILPNFLRQHDELQPCFQIEHIYHGKPRYIALEKAFHFEHASSYRMDEQTRDKLLEDMDEYEFFPEPIEGRIIFNQLEDFLCHAEIDFGDKSGLETVVREFNCQHDRAPEILRDLADFIHIDPRLPGEDKEFVSSPAIQLPTDASREDVIAYLQAVRETHPVADLAFYAYRDLSQTDWAPFMKAALERNPVSIKAVEEQTDDDVIAHMEALPNESIYDGPRLAQPDEVWNYGRGDGLERAICLAAIWKSRHPDTPVQLAAADSRVALTLGEREVTFPTHKGLEKTVAL